MFVETKRMTSIEKHIQWLKDKAVEYDKCIGGRLQAVAIREAILNAESFLVKPKSSKNKTASTVKVCVDDTLYNVTVFADSIEERVFYFGDAYLFNESMAFFLTEKERGKVMEGNPMLNVSNTRADKFLDEYSHFEKNR